MWKVTRLVLGGGTCLVAVACADSSTRGVMNPGAPNMAASVANVVPHNPAPGGPIPAGTVPLRSFTRNVGAFSLPTLLPESLRVTLAPGASHTESKTAFVPASPPLGDIMFSLDLTGSMGGELNNMKTNAINIMNAVAAVIPDVHFGVISYEDYNGFFTTSSAAGHGCDYASTYGAGGDAPYRLSNGLTSDRTNVSNAINGLVLGSGFDGPESYTRVFYESYAELVGNPNPTFGPIGWRAGSKKIVVNFGDAIPHDCDYDAIIGGSSDTGRDPGRDNVVGTADDLPILTTLQGMRSNNVTLINLNSGGSFLNPLWDAYAAVTGGTNFLINSDGSFPGGVDPATAIAALIQAEVGTIDSLTLAPCSGFGSYKSWITGLAPASYTNVTLPATKTFDITYTVPTGTPAGTYVFSVCATGDGVEYGKQWVTITVPAAGGYAIDIEPEDPDNNVSLGGLRLPIALLSTPGFDASTQDPSECRVIGHGRDTRLYYKALLRDVDHDGDMDLVIFYNIARLMSEGILTSSTTSLTVRCRGGFNASDVVVIV
jgi:hypothetical protein